MQRHRSIGREKTGKTLTIKRRVWDLALFTIESQDKKKRRQKMIGLCLLNWYYHYNLNFLVILKWYYDQKISSFFPSDFESVFIYRLTGKILSFEFYPKAVFF